MAVQPCQYVKAESRFWEQVVLETPPRGTQFECGSFPSVWTNYIFSLISGSWCHRHACTLKLQWCNPGCLYSGSYWMGLVPAGVLCSCQLEDILCQHSFWKCELLCCCGIITFSYSLLVYWFKFAFAWNSGSMVLKLCSTQVATCPLKQKSLCTWNMDFWILSQWL